MEVARWRAAADAAAELVRTADMRADAAQAAAREAEHASVQACSALRARVRTPTACAAHAPCLADQMTIVTCVGKYQRERRL